MTNWSASNANGMLQRLIAVVQLVPAVRLRYVLLLLVGVWFLSLLADLFWLVYPVPSVQPSLASRIAIPSDIGIRQAPSIDVITMQGWYLFGSEVQSPSVSQQESDQPEAPVDASITNLQLVLLGCLESDVPEESYAIIQTPAKADLIKVGQNIEVGNNITLARVLVDRVIINNRGKMESLLLYTGQEAPLAERVPDNTGTKRVIDQRKNTELSMMADNYRNQLMTNPMSLTDVIKVAIAKDANGKIMGYRIRPGRDRNQFAQFGLQTGDIVTAINGVPLDDPAKAMELYGQMRDAREASFSIRRGNDDINLMVSIGQ